MKARGANMAGEYNANIREFISTVLVNHPRLGIVKMNADSYNPATCGPIVEGPYRLHFRRIRQYRRLK
jgi:hypothetical protein